MKKLSYLIIAPLLLVDACTAARLEKTDTAVQPVKAPASVPAPHVSAPLGAGEPHHKRVIVINYSQAEEEGYALSTRLDTEVQLQPARRPWQSTQGKKSIIEIIQ